MKKGVIYFLISLLSIPNVLANRSILGSETINLLKQNPESPSILFNAFQSPLYVGIFLLALLFIISIYNLLLFNKEIIQEKIKRISKLDRYTPTIIRITFGLSLIYASINHSLFTTDMPFRLTILILLTLGIFFTLGIFTRILATITLGLFLFSFTQFGLIPFENLEYLAASIALIILGSGKFSLDNLFKIEIFKGLSTYKKYNNFIIRILLATSAIWISLTLYILNPKIGFALVQKLNLIYFISFTPEMWILLISLSQLIFGLFLLLGFMTRIITMTWFYIVLIASLIFGIPLLSHLTFFGILIILMIEGATHPSLDSLNS